MEQAARMMLSSASRCVFQCLTPGNSRGSGMVSVSAGFGDNVTTFAELCRELSRFFVEKRWGGNDASG